VACAALASTMNDLEILAVIVIVEACIAAAILYEGSFFEIFRSLQAGVLRRIYRITRPLRRRA
jgi:hypothetical protein